MGTAPEKIFEKRFQNTLEDLSRIGAEAKQFLEQNGVNERALYLADLAIEELGTNILKYAYRDSASHEIRLRLELGSGRLAMVFEDDGQPFDPVRAPVPDINLPAQQRVPGGLGIHLVRKLVDHMDYKRSGGLNRVKVEIRC